MVSLLLASVVVVLCNSSDNAFSSNSKLSTMEGINETSTGNKTTSNIVESSSANVTKEDTVLSTIVFDPIKNLSNNAGESKSAQVATSGNFVYVIWQDITSGNGDILFKRSSDNGKNFDSTKNLSNNAGVSSLGDPSFLSHSIVASGSSVYIVWSDSTPGKSDIFFAKSTDNGATFGPVKNLSNTADSFSIFPQLAVVGNYVYVAYTDGIFENNADHETLFVQRSTNGGNTFSSPRKIFDTESIYPRIAAAGNNVYVTGIEGSEDHRDVFFARSTNNGFSFGKVISINNSFEVSGIGDIIASGSNVYIVWVDSSLGDRAIFFRKSADGGATFASKKTLSNNNAGPGGAGGPYEHIPIQVVGTNVYVAWDEHKENGNVFFRKSTNGGDTFGGTRNLSNDGLSQFAAMSASGDKLVITWESNGEIFVKSSGNQGATFGSTKNISNNSGESGNAVVKTTAEGNTYVAWEDNTPGNLDILFRGGH